MSNIRTDDGGNEGNSLGQNIKTFVGFYSPTYWSGQWHEMRVGYISLCHWRWASFPLDSLWFSVAIVPYAKPPAAVSEPPDGTTDLLSRVWTVATVAAALCALSGALVFFCCLERKRAPDPQPLAYQMS
jgi:hypothetical protein